MILLPDTAISVLTCGGGLRINSTKFLPDVLIRLAAAAAAGNARLEIIVDGIMLPDTMMRIATAGRGAVLFDTAGS